ncbi:MAG: rhodanese-like domain-containing protein [Chloroflexi bacterium]|nr:rhodanese-like domain-containing protein [Chloroflexota bacterium]
MKPRSYLLLLLVIFSLMLAACSQTGTANNDPVVEEPTAVVEEVEDVADVEEVEPTAVPEVVEPTAEPVVDEFTSEELDASFEVFLADMEGYNAIGLEAFNAMLVEDPAPFILDVREASELEEKGWIPGAVHIPIRELADNVNLLPSFDTTIVSYCGSGWRCTIALTGLESLGWENVMGLKENSFTGWVEAGYAVETGELPAPAELDAATPDPAAVSYWDTVFSAIPEGYGGISIDDLNLKIAENPELILIDVRTAEEVETNGYIDAPNVLFIPIKEIVARQAEWPTDLDVPIVVYCGSGHRSTIAMTMLWAYGYTDVLSMKGGYAEWLKAGYTTVGGVPPTPDLDTVFTTFLTGMEAYNAIGIEDLNVLIVEENAPFLLDVRQPEELLENGWLEGAVHIPIREVAAHLDLLPSFDTPIVAYCASGWRCTIAVAALEGLGWENVLALKENSFTGWVDAGYPVVTGTELPVAEPLNAAAPDPALVETFNTMLAAIPEGYGGISADDLNTKLVENPDLILIDVRTAEEIAEKGVIEAENIVAIPLAQFIELKAMWPQDLNAPIVIYCGSGHRSTLAMTILWSYGYTDVLSLKGGFAAWTDAGYAVATME